MYKNNVVNAIVQARMKSTRLPGKVLLPLGRENKPVLQHIIERLRRSKYIDNVIVACTDNDEDIKIVDLCNKLGCGCYQGSEEDVLTRVLEAAKINDTDIIVEVTADCVFVSGELADFTIEKMVEDNSEYASNVIKRMFPRGYDLQVFYTNTLQRLSKFIDNPIDSQHVSTILYKSPFQMRKDLHICKSSIGNKHGDYSHIRLTLDTEDDYKLINLIFKLFDDRYFCFEELKLVIDDMPEMFEINKHIEQKSYYKELAEWYYTNQS